MAVNVTTRCEGKGCDETIYTTTEVAKKHPLLCGKCIAEVRKLKGAEKEEHFAKLAELPIEERLRQIESWIYAHSRKKHNQGPKGPKVY